jgi:hypothetical protein
MSYDAIKEGDFVKVCFPDNGYNTIYGTVRRMAQATGECWVIETEMALHYVQSFMQIVKDKPIVNEADRGNAK